MCSLLLGFGLDAYICVGTKARGASHTWVATIAGDSRVTFWESLTGDRLVDISHSELNLNLHLTLNFQLIVNVQHSFDLQFTFNSLCTYNSPSVFNLLTTYNFLSAPENNKTDLSAILDAILNFPEMPGLGRHNFIQASSTLEKNYFLLKFTCFIVVSLLIIMLQHNVCTLCTL